MKRELLIKQRDRAESNAQMGINNGFLFTMIGAMNAIFESSGIKKNYQESAFGKKMAKWDPMPKVSKWMDKHWTPATLAIGGVLMAIGMFSWARASEKSKELEALGKPDQKVIIPDNLSEQALGSIPIRPMDEQELRKVAPADIKKFTERLNQEAPGASPKL